MADETADTVGVTADDMQSYLNLDSDGDASILEGLISTAESAVPSMTRLRLKFIERTLCSIRRFGFW